MKYIIRLFRLAKPWVGYLAIATFAMFSVSGIGLLIPYLTKIVIGIMESGQSEHRMNDIVFLSGILLACFLVRGVAQFFQNYYAHVASWRLVDRTRRMVYDHLQSLSMSYYHDKQTGQLMSRVINDTATFESLISHAVPELASNVLTLVGVFAIMLMMNPLLTLLVCIPIPFILTMSVIIRKIRKYFTEGQELIAELNGVLQDNFSGIKEIQVFGRQKYESARVGEKSSQYSTSILRALFFSGILNPAVGAITNVGTVIVLIAGPIFAVRYGLNISDVVAFLLYLALFYAPVANLTHLVENIQLSLAGAERVFEILDTESDISDAPDAVNTGRLSGQIKFDNVTFSYGDEINVLDNISFEVGAGEMVAIVGPTGVGKTTISGLIARFYDPVSGCISMDGVDIKSMTLKSLRSQLSLVLQDVFLFNGTIAENIAYGCDNANEEEIRYAASIACIDDYISSLPDGYNTIIGERGMRLSGGQKQRISIARSVLRDSPILILDEATSSVDAETEAEIQKAITKIAGTRSLIIIAHRLTTVRRADRIIVLSEGKIAETGTHDELIEKDGLYAQLTGNK